MSFVEIDSFIKNSFIGTSKSGLLRSNRFKVIINAPSAVYKRFGSVQGTDSNGIFLSYNAIAVSCPNIAMEIGSTEINTIPHYYYKGRIDSDMSVTFLETPDLKMRRFFNEWIRLGYDINTGKREYIDNVRGRFIEIQPLTAKGNVTFFDYFEEVFPYEINNLDFNAGTDNEILKTEVKFKFQRHDIRRA